MDGTALTGEREAARRAFLAGTEWADAVVLPLAADASTRSYARLSGGPRPALLMDAPPAAETAACPPGADPVERAALGYNAEARLAGSSLAAFAGLSDWLRARGVHAPTVFARDEGQGFAVIEDMGDRLLARASDDDAAERAHYARALRPLARLREAGATPGDAAGWPLQTYDETALLAEVRLLPQWYVPYTGGTLTEAAAASYEAAWREALGALGPCDTLVLRDYHAENILVLDDGDGDGVGVIDFQDALIGSSAYDLASLLEDARRDVGERAARDLYAQHADGAADRARFEIDYALLAAQRNAKILGIFARLIERDGKPRYGAFLPRVRAHLARDLARPPLEPVRGWMRDHLPELVAAP